MGGSHLYRPRYTAREPARHLQKQHSADDSLQTHLGVAHGTAALLGSSVSGPGWQQQQQHHFTRAQMLSIMLLCWGWSFHLLSRLCFCMAEAYAYLVESLILKPTGYSPFLATKRVRLAVLM